MAEVTYVSPILSDEELRELERDFQRNGPRKPARGGTLRSHGPSTAVGSVSGTSADTQERNHGS